MIPTFSWQKIKSNFYKYMKKHQDYGNNDLGISPMII